MCNTFKAVAGSIIAAVFSPSTLADTELDAMQMLERVLTHEIKATPGFRARVIVPPGELYAPLVMHA